MKRARKQDVNRMCQEIIARLDKFFGTVPYSVEWAKGRSGRLGAVITYTDFLSEQLAAKMMSEFMPKEVKVVLKREYSDRAISKILLQEYRKNRIAVVDCYGGELRAEPVRVFVNGKLDAVEMLS